MAALAVVGLGMAAFSAPNTSAVMGSVDRSQLSIAGSLIATMRFTGQAVSVTLLGGIAGPELGPSAARSSSSEHGRSTRRPVHQGYRLAMTVARHGADRGALSLARPAATALPAPRVTPARQAVTPPSAMTRGATTARACQRSGMRSRWRHCRVGGSVGHGRSSPAPGDGETADDEREAAAARYAAAGRVESLTVGPTIGLGSGRAVAAVIERPRRRWPAGPPLLCAAASAETERLARGAGFPVVSLDDRPRGCGPVRNGTARTRRARRAGRERLEDAGLRCSTWCRRRRRGRPRLDLSRAAAARCCARG